MAKTLDWSGDSSTFDGEQNVDSGLIPEMEFISCAFLKEKTPHGEWERQFFAALDVNGSDEENRYPLGEN